jgi:uncharacterized protein (TIGR00369 family)
MSGFTAKDPDFHRRVQGSYDRQTFMHTIGARLVKLEPGVCELEMPTRPDLCQQHGYIHAGVTTTLADTAAGYAAFSLMPAGSSVLTSEFKINLLNPAEGDKLVARAEVEKPGRTLVVVRADVFGVRNGRERKVATMLATMMCLADTADQPAVEAAQAPT